MKWIKIIIPFVSLLLPVSCNQATEKMQEGTNFVIIYCDDLGYGDLGCFGATDIKTPNIDRMAKEGMKFTEFYSASPVCSPSRAALMTGRIPQRMGVHGVFFPESYTGMPVEENTIADLLKTRGYATGIVGKWHLGHMHRYLPLQRGFDEYFGIPYSNDMESVVYLEGNEVVDFHPDQSLTTKTYTEKALDFIDRHAGNPFFLYLAHSMPHVPIYASEDFLGTSDRGLYGDVIQELDWSVGQVLDKLEDEGILENTLVVFSSDNGPWLVMRDHGGSAGGLREGKQYTFEGGQRVPTLAMWPDGIRPATVYDDMGLMMDWLPTICEIAGVALPDDRDYDGESLVEVFDGQGKREQNEFLYYDGTKLECYRKGDWKIKLAYDGFEGATWKHAVPPHPLLLINLKEDPGELNNLAEEYPEKVKEMLESMEQYKQSKGSFPPPLFIRSDADRSHYDHVIEKYGEDYYLMK
ncbi:MAG: sulfatase [Bacteroidales bacterium]|nr:sulfatase [Bacteroidales bacterium]